MSQKANYWRHRQTFIAFHLFDYQHIRLNLKKKSK